MSAVVFDTVCLSGGGVKGFAFIGALDYLQIKSFIDISTINNWVGTSAGAVIGFLFVLGYTTQEIGDFILDFNFKCIEPDATIDNLLEFYGFDNGEKMIWILSNFLKEKFDIVEVSFIELFNLTNKKLTIIGTNYSKGIEAVFNHELTPNMSVLLAVRISSSIPIIFTPVLLDNDYYIDGALINNFPINYCNKSTTLGLYIKNGWSNELKSVVGLINGCLGIVADTISEKCFTNDDFVIQIPNYKQEFTDFNLDHDKKLKIINTGQTFAKKYLETNPLAKTLKPAKFTDQSTQTDTAH